MSKHNTPTNVANPDSPFVSSDPGLNVTMQDVYRAQGLSQYTKAGSMLRIAAFGTSGELEDGVSPSAGADFCFPSAAGTTNLQQVAKRMSEFHGPVAVQIAAYPGEGQQPQWEYVGAVLADV